MLRQEFVAQSLALGRAPDETRDVHELHDRGHDALGRHDRRQLRQPRIRHFHHADVRLDGAERIVGRIRVRRGERVEQRGLADVGQSDDPECQHGSSRALNVFMAAPIPSRTASAIASVRIGRRSRMHARSSTPNVSSTKSDSDPCRHRWSPGPIPMRSRGYSPIAARARCS